MRLTYGRQLLRDGICGANLFPERTAELNGWLAEAGLLRLYAGIHDRFDITAGAALGVAVGQLAIAQSGVLAP